MVWLAIVWKVVEKGEDLEVGDGDGDGDWDRDWLSMALRRAVSVFWGWRRVDLLRVLERLDCRRRDRDS